MIYSKIVDSVMELSNNLLEKEVVIFGIGKGGQLTDLVLRNLGISNYYFVDNNKEIWGTVVRSIPVFPPSQLLLENKENLIILVSTSYYDEVSTQLLSMGFDENIHFFSALGLKRTPSLMLGKIKELPANNNLIIFGDSVYSHYSNNDKNRTPLRDILSKMLSHHFKLGIFDYEAFHIGNFHLILHTLICFF